MSDQPSLPSPPDVPSPPALPPVSSPQVYQQPPRRRRRWPWVVLIFFLIVGGIYGFFASKWGPDPSVWVDSAKRCRYESREFSAEMNKLIARWDDKVKVAGQTSRIGLGTQVNDLQTIRREVLELESPGCAEEAQESAGEYMESVVDAFLAFMSQKSDSEVTRLFTAAKEKQDAFILEYTLIGSSGR